MDTKTHHFTLKIVKIHTQVTNPLPKKAVTKSRNIIFYCLPVEFNNIPLEIIIDTLSRMPIKTLFRFKCVCKSWRNLIESPEFFKLHLNKSLKKDSYNCSLILTVNRNVTINGFTVLVRSLCRAHLDLNNVKLEISQLVMPHCFRPELDRHAHCSRRMYLQGDKKLVLGKLEIAGSCNGLILVLNGIHHFAVGNPAIKPEHAFKVLPSISYSGYNLFYTGYGTYGIDFDDQCHQKSYATDINNLPYPRYRRSFEFRVFGFGYDCYNHCYKIVYLTPTRALLCSLTKTNHAWKSLELPGDVVKHDLDPEDDPTQIKLCMTAHNHGVPTNKHLHWSITEHESNELAFEYSKEKILRFDLHSEEWGEVPVPDELDQGQYCLKKRILKKYIVELGILDGCLCLLISRGISYPYLDLWIMKEYGVKESWTKLFKVPNGSGIPLYCRKDRYEFLLPGEQHGLGWYNPRENKVRKVEFHGCEFSGEHYYSNRVTICNETFVHPFTSMEIVHGEEEMY